MANEMTEQAGAMEQVGPFVVADGGQIGENRFRTMEQGFSAWTLDIDEALQFARRKDAETFAAEDDEAWQILPVPTERSAAEPKPIGAGLIAGTTVGPLASRPRLPAPAPPPEPERAALAWRLAAYSTHKITCAVKYGQACEEGTVPVLSSCTCGLQELIEEARAAQPAGDDARDAARYRALRESGYHRGWKELIELGCTGERFDQIADDIRASPTGAGAV